MNVKRFTDEEIKARRRAYKRLWNRKARQDPEYKARELAAQRERYRAKREALGLPLRSGKLSRKHTAHKIRSYAREVASNDNISLEEALRKIGAK